MNTEMLEEVADQIRDYEVSQIRGTPLAELFSPADDEVAGAMEGRGFKLTKTQSDKVMVYDAHGVPSEIMVYMLSKKLQQGFTLHPQSERVMGDLKCYLHPESEFRAEMDASGLRGRYCCLGYTRPGVPCDIHPQGCYGGKSNLMTEWDLELHMRHRHKNEWATIERARQRQRDNEAREFQRIQSEAMERLAAQGAPTRKAG